MKKGIIFILLIVFLLFVSARMVFAASYFGNLFGGRIIYTKAVEIEAWESAGYTCPMFGTSISIMPIGSPFSTPTSFFIPSFVTPKTRTTPAPHQLIIGKYSGQMTIICILPSNPPDVQTVSLDTIILFGTSRR